MLALAKDVPPACGGTTPEAFAGYHMAALERNEARHTVVLGMLGSGMTDFRFWTLGAPGQCAMQAPGRHLVLGELTRPQCHALATQIEALDYPGVVGPDLTAHWFIERAVALGHRFADPMPQMIHCLSGAPQYPGAAGAARVSRADDAPLIFDWACAFVQEAVPHESPPDRSRSAQRAADGHYVLWTVNDTPVAMASIGRWTRNAAAIAPVYTPPPLRGRGYAGSVVAATVDLIRARGRPLATLYTDLRNPFSNRCYAKVGFKPVCPSWHYPRTPQVDGR